MTLHDGVQNFFVLNAANLSEEDKKDHVRESQLYNNERDI